MPKVFITSGYLDVKISAKAKRGFTPWKAWKKQWCEIKRLDNINNGLEIKLKSSAESNSGNCFVIPRNATICRTESRTKNYSFGIFNADRHHKPLLFLSGASETDSQLWMISMRRLLCLNSHIPVPDGAFYISVVDNDHSRVAGLTGLHGILTTNTHEVVIKDPSTGDTRTSFAWHHLHQFHLAATSISDDDKKIVVVHTSKEFRSGAGQLHIFCQEASSLLKCLVTRGKVPRIYINSFMDTRRLSRSEGDLSESFNTATSSAGPTYYYRSHCGSDDSGVRVSMASDDSNLVMKCKKAASFISLGFGLLVATPGGSEVDNESSHDLLLENEEEQILTEICALQRTMSDPRRESGVSLMSGVYEEIPDIPPPKEFQNQTPEWSTILHTYEDPVDIILGSAKKFTPPPLPPRHETKQRNSDSDEDPDFTIQQDSAKVQALRLQFSCETSDTSVDSESEYMVMTPAKQPQSETENYYMPMSKLKPTNLFTSEEENGYMIMIGKKST